MKKNAVIVFFILVFVSIAVVGIWYWGIPNHYVADRIEGLSIAPINIKVEGFTKRPLFKFNVDRVVVKNNNNEIWSVRDLSGSIEPLQLLKRQAIINVYGKSYRGSFSGIIRVSKNEQVASISFADIDASEISFFRSTGFDGKGMLSGSLDYGNGKGNLKFVVDDVELKGFSGGGFFIPLEYFHTVRGAVEMMSPNNLLIKSIALSGEGIYVRVKGKVEKGLVDLEVEVMPETSFTGNSLLMLIEKYKISDGYYYIPVKKHL